MAFLQRTPGAPSTVGREAHDFKGNIRNAPGQPCYNIQQEQQRRKEVTIDALLQEAAHQLDILAPNVEEQRSAVPLPDAHPPDADHTKGDLPPPYPSRVDDQDPPPRTRWLVSRDLAQKLVLPPGGNSMCCLLSDLESEASSQESGSDDEGLGASPDAIIRDSAPRILSRERSSSLRRGAEPEPLVREKAFTEPDLERDDFMRRMPLWMQEANEKMMRKRRQREQARAALAVAASETSSKGTVPSYGMLESEKPAPVSQDGDDGETPHQPARRENAFAEASRDHTMPVNLDVPVVAVESSPASDSDDSEEETSDSDESPRQPARREHAFTEADFEREDFREATPLWVRIALEKRRENMEVRARASPGKDESPGNTGESSSDP